MHLRKLPLAVYAETLGEVEARQAQGRSQVALMYQDGQQVSPLEEELLLAKRPPHPMPLLVLSKPHMSRRTSNKLILSLVIVCVVSQKRPEPQHKTTIDR